MRSGVRPFNTTAAAPARAKISRRGTAWALEGIVCQHLSAARVAQGLAVAWNTANDAVLAEGHRVLIADPHRFDGVHVPGVDEHVWRHTRHGEKYVTVIIDLPAIRDGTALGLRNFTHYIARILLETGGFRTRLHPQL